MYCLEVKSIDLFTESLATSVFLELAVHHYMSNLYA